MSLRRVARALEVLTRAGYLTSRQRSKLLRSNAIRGLNAERKLTTQFFKDVGVPEKTLTNDISYARQKLNAALKAVVGAPFVALGKVLKRPRDTRPFFSKVSQAVIQEKINLLKRIQHMCPSIPIPTLLKAFNLGC